MVCAWSIRAQKQNAPPGLGLLQPPVLLFEPHLEKQSPRHAGQNSRPSKHVAQSLLWLGSTPCRCTCSRCGSSTGPCNQQGVPTDDTSHPPMVSCMAASRHLSLPQRRRFCMPWARHNTPSLCSVRSGTGRSAKDVSPHSGSLHKALLQDAVGKAPWRQTLRWLLRCCTRLPMVPAHSVCVPRTIGQQGTIILTRGWKFPGINLVFFWHLPPCYTGVLSTRRRLWR